MTRPIKFRVWDKIQNKFINGIPPKEYMLDPDSEWSHHDIDDDPCVYINNVFTEDFNGRLVFQQYTGYKDSDNKEIYEGDILKNLTPHKYSSDTFVVKWGEFEPSDDMGVGGVGFVLPWFYTTFKPKVIGNIFENPELLK